MMLYILLPAPVFDCHTAGECCDYSCSVGERTQKHTHTHLHTPIKSYIKVLPYSTPKPLIPHSITTGLWYHRFVCLVGSQIMYLYRLVTEPTWLKPILIVIKMIIINHRLISIIIASVVVSLYYNIEIPVIETVDKISFE